MALKKEDWEAIRFEAGQLFTPSAPISQADLFAGRKKEIAQLFETIAERGRHAIVYGERGVGKTSLSQVVPVMLPKGLRRIHFIRQSIFPTESFSDLWKRVFRQITVRPDWDQTSAPVSDFYLARDITPEDVVVELSKFNQNEVPIIVVDEFNESIDTNISKLMANTIKGLSDTGANSTLIIVGVADNIDDLIDGHHSISRCCEEVLMPRMKNEELKDLLEARISRLDFNIEGSAKWKIINLSKGLPTFVHSLGKYSCYAAITRRRKTVAEEDIDSAIEHLLDSSQQTLKSAFRTAVSSNQPNAKFRLVLTACALAPTDDAGFFTQTAVRGPLSEMSGRSVEIAHLRPQLNELILEKRGAVIERTGEERAYRYRFSDPAMQPYVIMAGIKAGILTDRAMSALSAQPDLFANLPERAPR